MNIAITVIKMIGGLALLIYGMNLLSTNLKKLAGEKFENILKKATDNVFKGLMVGILITVAVQSSAATTVMVVGFVNAEILKLRNAIPIIMGANIGTTITAQILRLASLNENSIVSLISPATLAPIFLIVGLLLIEMKKKQKFKDCGQLLIGIGLLFTGLMTMVNMASSLSDLPILTTILTKLSNPILGVLAGAVITIIVQSSAATVGILQAISTTGFTSYASTIPIILGQNIGTCLTSILSSVGASKNARRAAAVHLYFNLIGTILFMIVIYGYQGLIGFSFWNEAMDMGGIANFHLIFNIVSTLVLLPATGLLEKITILTIKDKKGNQEEEDTSEYLSVLNLLDERLVSIPSMGIANSLKVILKMGEVAEKNFRKSIQLTDRFDMKKLQRIQEREDAIDKMDVTVTNFLVKIGNLEITEQESKNVTVLLKIDSELEKIGDYAYKFSKLIENMNEKEQEFSINADKELKIMYNMVEETILKTLKAIEGKEKDVVIEIEALKQLAERYREEYKICHIERMKAKQCSVETGMAFMEILTVYERIIGHCINISVAAINYVTDEDYVTKHEYYHSMSVEDKETLRLKLEELNHRYELLARDDKLCVT